MAENNKDNKEPKEPNQNNNQSNDNSNDTINSNDKKQTNNNDNTNTTQDIDIQMNDKSTSKDTKSKSTKKDNKRHRSRYRHKSRSDSHSPSRSRSRSGNNNNNSSSDNANNDTDSRSNSSHSDHHSHSSRHRSRRSHRHTSRSNSHTPSYRSSRRRDRSHRDSRRNSGKDYRRNHRRSHRDRRYRRDRDRDRHSSRTHRRDRDRRSHSTHNNSSSHSHSHSHSRDRSHSSDRRHKKKHSKKHIDNGSLKSNNCGIHGPTMDIRVTVFPKSTPGESKVITLCIARTSTVSDFKGTLCTKGFNVFLQYNLLVRDKELDVSDDRLLCIHVGIKPNENDKHIIVKPKNGIVPPIITPIITPNTNNNNNNNNNNNMIGDKYDPFSAGDICGRSVEEIEAEKKKRLQERADQIEMYKAYEEMFGVEEAAGMMGLDAIEVKKMGIECIIDRLEEEKEKLRLDKEAAEAARSHMHMTNDNINKQYDYSEELLFASHINDKQYNNNNDNDDNIDMGKGENAIYNENVNDSDTAIGTTHTAGGGTVSRPPPEHVSENACIFVGDLHPSVTRSDLLSVFSQIGSVQWIQLFDCHKQMNRPFNFAFVYFEDLLCARNAIQTLNYTKFYGSPCRLMWKQEKNSVQWTDCNIIVKNLPPNTDSQLLHSVFSKFGKILSSKVKTTSTGRTLPYGYVQYGTKNGADKAIIASDRGELSVNGHMLTAEWFKSREDRAFRQIYVKNIPSNWSDQDLLNLFEAQTLGKIKSFTVKHSPYGRWACISFHEPHHAVKAIDKLNNCPTGDPLCPNLSVSRFMYKTERDKFKSMTTLNMGLGNVLNNTQQQMPTIINTPTNMNMNINNNNNNNINNISNNNNNNNNSNINQCYSIYVGNVPLQLTDEHMRQLFEPFGAVISAAVVQKTQDYKYGFVNFQQPEDAARALVTMNGKSIGGKTLQVKPANTDMSKAIAITQAANKTHNILTNIHTQKQQHVQQQKHHQQQPNITHKQAKEILLIKDGNNKPTKEKVWKVQYGEDWHEYDTTLAAIVEQLNCGEQIQITLADSNYIITRIQNDQAMQKNCASGTMRKVVRSQRDLQ